MFMFRMGKRRINLAYLIQAEEIEGGIVRVTMDAGKEFDDSTENGPRLLARLDELADAPPASVVTHSISRKPNPPGRPFGEASA